MPTTATAAQEAAWSKAWRAWDAARGEPDRKRPTLQQQLDTGYVEVPGDGRTALPLPRLDDWNGSIVGFGPKRSLLAVPDGCTLVDGHCTIRGVRTFGGEIVFKRDGDNNEANFNTIRNVVFQETNVFIEGAEFSNLDTVWGIRSTLAYLNGLNYKNPPPTNSRHTLTNVAFNKITFAGNTHHVDGRGIWAAILAFHAFEAVGFPGGGGIGRVPSNIRLESVNSDSKAGIAGVTVIANGFTEHNGGKYPDSIVINGRPLASWVGAALEPVATHPVQQVIDALARGMQA